VNITRLLYTAHECGAEISSINRGFSDEQYILRMKLNHLERYTEIVLSEKQKTIDVLEQLRPVWAFGHSDAAVKEQICSTALSAIWKELGVTDQTACMEKLRQLMAEKKQ
jgi:predicted HNH restriction endonuclease